MLRISASVHHCATLCERSVSLCASLPHSAAQLYASQEVRAQSSRLQIELESKLRVEAQLNETIGTLENTIEQEGEVNTLALAPLLALPLTAGCTLATVSASLTVVMMKAKELKTKISHT